MDTSPNHLTLMATWAAERKEPEVCDDSHDGFTMTISLGLCIGILISYLPQHYRIISHKNSEGFSPWFLLLGSIGSWSSVLNMILLQWGTLKCCRTVPTSVCFEHLLGIAQVSIQWACFLSIVILFIVYYPVKGKKMINAQGMETGERSSEWKDALIAAWSVFAHITLVVLVSFTFLSLYGPTHPVTRGWASALGLISMIITFLQYVPQLWHTWVAKRVGSLSIPMMCIQTPGAFVFAYSLGSREGTNWTSWITFLVAGVMQGSLLLLCIIWRSRERREERSRRAQEREIGGEEVIGDHPLDRADERTSLLNSSQG